MSGGQALSWASRVRGVNNNLTQPPSTVAAKCILEFYSALQSCGLRPFKLEPCFGTCK